MKGDGIRFADRSVSVDHNIDASEEMHRAGKVQEGGLKVNNELRDAPLKSAMIVQRVCVIARANKIELQPINASAVTMIKGSDIALIEKSLHPRFCAHVTAQSLTNQIANILTRTHRAEQSPGIQIDHIAMQEITAVLRSNGLNLN
jgi:hypothetical protein